MTARRLFEPRLVRNRSYPPTDQPRCQARVIVNSDFDARWRRERYGGADWNVCTFPAHVEIDGRLYCNRHGGEVALAKLLGEEVTL